VLRTLALALFVACSLACARAARAQELVPLPPQPAGVAWPTAEWPEAAPGPDVDRAALAAAVDGVFAKIGRAGVPDGRALVVVHRGAIVAEHYAPGFSRETRFTSWSMAKSVTQALAGILVREGRLALDVPAPVPAWNGDGDPRRVVTLDHLLHMTSGLDADDGSEGPDSLVARLLFGPGAADSFAYAAALPLAHPPDTRWAYSTATSALVSGVVQRAAGGTREAMLAFMRRELFEPLGMRSPVPEFDAAGSFQGGACFWASARDWARFGYLYLRDGVFDGRRILPSGWVDYTRTPAPAPNNGTHGAHFWLNREPAAQQFRLLPGGPRSAFAATGAYGQYVLLVPTHDLVVVRLGQMHAHAWDELGAELAAVVAAFPASQPEEG
jgi:CubicO group peptidase (beta-lactamase class C family)